MLTDERILDLWSPESRRPVLGKKKIVAFARAIEAEVRKEQADQIAELEREVATWVRRSDKTWNEAVSAEKIAELERQLAEARKDAERIEELEVLAARWTRLVNGLGDVLTGEGMDKTVDAAIKAKEQP